MISTIKNQIKFIPLPKSNILTTERGVRFWNLFTFFKGKHPFDMLLKAASWFALLSCGIIIGCFAGSLVGWYMGGIYSEKFGPVYFSDSVDFTEIVHWIELPHKFAVSGQAIGVFLGPFFMLILSKIYSNRHRVEQNNIVKTPDS
jgi:hypothetical protein